MVGLVGLIPVMVLTVKDTCLVDLATFKTNFLIPLILKFFEKSYKEIFFYRYFLVVDLIADV